MRVKVLYPLLMNNSLVKSSWTCKCCLAQDRDYVLNISRIDQKWTPSLQFIHVQVNVYKYAFTTCIITNKRLQIRIYKLHIYKLHIYKCIIWIDLNAAPSNWPSQTALLALWQFLKKGLSEFCNFKTFYRKTLPAGPLTTLFYRRSRTQPLTVWPDLAEFRQLGHFESVN